jgi:hypothetical protein
MVESLATRDFDGTEPTPSLKPYTNAGDGH